LRKTLRSRLSAYKVPQRIVFLADAEVPMLSSGKLDARAPKELLREG
jgi:acyl-CoA synthetase (AMP-forming)/AMP-acid ligase II